MTPSPAAIAIRVGFDVFRYNPAPGRDTIAKHQREVFKCYQAAQGAYASWRAARSCARPVSHSMIDRTRLEANARDRADDLHAGDPSINHPHMWGRLLTCGGLAIRLPPLETPLQPETPAKFAACLARSILPVRPVT
jgi:hypothetical protein